MPAIKIKDNIFSVGVLNPSLRIFDIIMKTEYGTSYNAYLIKGKKNVLIDTVHGRFFDEYLENIKSVIDPSSIDYVIMNHCEPDHSGSLARLYEVAPQIKVIASNAGKIYLKNITNKETLDVKAVKTNDTLDIGNGKVLKFAIAPFLHWPDSMFTILEEDKIAFTCDFLGCHFCEPRMFDTKITYMPKYEKSFKEYYDAIFSPFKPYVVKGLDILDALDLDFIATSHGPILTREGLLAASKQKYRDLSSEIQSTTKYIPIFYCSAYGNTEILANEIASGIKSVLNDANIEMLDIINYDYSDLKEKINICDAFMLGTPTINKDALFPIWELIGGIDAVNCKNKPASAFGSFGWSGEAIPFVISRLKELKLKVFQDGFTCLFVPSEDDIKKAFKFGEDFAKSI
ncbi:flavorubredoxin [Clostridium acetobutylicum]|uniref:Flavo-diiron protein FprA2 n=1 Tax=Clostridium acetobutylicum (strain ATCC 824 / DSM 792 / JCM 1419 / IAM 19013 / LMG 5710 / NBRC 13948 / NRRL B-527 / VKM B-1787 / 2291 / W) TaxID=272562 RepID=FPRA2_CLOAB|nr:MULTISPECIES: FprA family A-type flavoprotein [Clostridium]Q97GC0.1 RecName: Full=Flavo-diiron protein FprA2; Short=FDP 2; AltName: Full=Flavoprotein A2; AltName: Full=H(2)O-forming NADH oxidase; AltName: Full=NADH oxidase; AltName: Full=NADH:O(2) oxidoreductase [Clostridium acetobutylicum ATCC 824]AAK80403.1 Predicted flavoprotein [Clostridium acetobutylicum ATCC 824]AEI34513.1 flavoprotein [Clostridium acetobutylicum DSM 1731]AWV79179.1 FprA family A-type flavoprotein [Clostridium acetobut